jgi:ppGpp synthetase/RelA/SpoT-type nucleotidyltranferase
MDLVETLADATPAMVVASPAWSALRDAVVAAPRKSALRVVEDQVDAVVAAYVGLFAERAPERTTTYGDFARGYIVTPTLPEGLDATPRTARARRSPEDVVRAAVAEYAATHDAVLAAADGWVELVTAVLDDAGINYLSVTGRAKGVASFAAKAGRVVDGVLAFPEPLSQVTDQVGVRVITYVHSDVAAVADLLADQVVVHDDRDMGQETASEGRWGYASRHLLVGLDSGREGQPEYVALASRRAQVQIRTVLQHAWAEFEHDIRYKGDVPDEHAPDLDRRFTLAAGLLELADREFATIRDRLQEGMTGQAPAPADDDPRISPRELAAFLAGQYADAGWSRTDHYAWISGLLLELGVTSLAELGDVLRPLDSAALVDRMGYRYPPGAVRRLDDALLAAFGERYVGLSGNAGRTDALTARLAKLVGPA